MRVNVSVLAMAQFSRNAYTVPVNVQIGPSSGMQGEHQYITDSHALMAMLKRKTEVPGYSLDMFMTQLKLRSKAFLTRVELSDQVLREIGYFVD